jgi:large subunit ribosomal protein L24
MQSKLKIKKGDIVKVIAGDSRGKEGRVLRVLVKSSRVIVEGINLISRHTKPNAKHTKGGIIKREAPVHISNVMLVDGSGNATRVGRMTDEKTGKLVRYSKKSEKMEVLK